jgi:hypothetical protein
MEEHMLQIHIRGDDPLFDRAQELANEIVAALAYWVVQPIGDGTYRLPTVSRAITEINQHADGSLLAMFTFALGVSAKNMAIALATERGCTVEQVLDDFLRRPTT